MKPDESEVRQVVEETLRRLMGQAEEKGGVPGEPRRRIIDAAFIDSLPPESVYHVPAGSRVTPLARDHARERGIRLVEGSAVEVGRESAQPGARRIAIGADHGGYTLKETLKPYLTELGWQVLDLGTHSTESVDYPDYAYAVAVAVAQGQVAYGIMIDGAGIGSAMACNKVPGIRAAMCYDIATAVNSREHNHANVLTLGAGMIGANLAKQIVKAWLETSYGGGRHQRRVDKIMAIERRFLRKGQGGE